jgi:hypothetical protein
MGVGFVPASDARILLIVMNQKLIYIDFLSHLWPQFEPRSHLGPFLKTVGRTSMPAGGVPVYF